MSDIQGDFIAAANDYESLLKQTEQGRIHMNLALSTFENSFSANYALVKNGFKAEDDGCDVEQMRRWNPRGLTGLIENFNENIINHFETSLNCLKKVKEIRGDYDFSTIGTDSQNLGASFGFLFASVRFGIVSKLFELYNDMHHADMSEILEIKMKAIAAEFKRINPSFKLRNSVGRMEEILEELDKTKKIGSVPGRDIIKFQIIRSLKKC